MHGVAGARRLPEIVCTEDEADEEQEAAEGSNVHEKLRTRHRIEEVRIGQHRAAFARGAEHQALGDTAHPHRCDVEQNADEPEPEVHISERVAIELLSSPEAWREPVK